MDYKIAICIPTYNAGKIWPEVLRSINDQKLQPFKRFIIDSGSKDDTVKLALENSFDVTKISLGEFDHGGTRQSLINKCADIDICVFLTQDAILANSYSLENIIDVFKNSEIGMAYGRQLPHKTATVLEAHARLFNYPEESQLRGKEQIEIYGFKTIFCSNSFAAYRIASLKIIGGFPLDSIMGEDTIVAAKMIAIDLKVAYVSSAMVYHSHAYTVLQEFKRYFDTGAFHAQNLNLYNQFGKPTGEGFKFVLSEIKFSIVKNPLSTIMIFPKTVAKFIGYKMGQNYKSLPLKLIRLISMHKHFWR